MPSDYFCFGLSSAEAALPQHLPPALPGVPASASTGRGRDCEAMLSNDFITYLITTVAIVLLRFVAFPFQNQLLFFKILINM